MLFTASSSSSFYFLPSCLRVSFFRLPAIFFFFFATRNFAYSRLFPAHCAYVLPQQKCKHVRSAVLETWMAASERRGRSVVVGRVETWASAKVRSRPGMQPGSERARSVVESRDLDAKSQASAKIYSRPGCNEPSKCENLLETWMQRASECENLLETCTSRPGWIECEGPLRRFTLAHAKKT
jgi:hypothetical protein